MTGNEAVTHTDSEKGIHLKIKFRIEEVGLGFLSLYCHHRFRTGFVLFSSRH